MYRIRVASDSADNLSSSSLLLEFIWSVSEIQQPIEKFSKVALERNWTRDHLFTGVSPPKSCYSQWKHRCFIVWIIKGMYRDIWLIPIVLMASFLLSLHSWVLSVTAKLSYNIFLSAVPIWSSLSILEGIKFSNWILASIESKWRNVLSPLW